MIWWLFGIGMWLLISASVSVKLGFNDKDSELGDSRLEEIFRDFRRDPSDVLATALVMCVFFLLTPILIMFVSE